MRRAIIISVAASVAVAVVSLLAMQLARGPASADTVQRVVLMLWPSSIFLLGSQSPTHSPPSLPSTQCS